MNIISGISFFVYCRYLILFLLSCIAHSHATSATSISFRSVNATNTLSQSSVLSMLQDSTGFLWVGTKDGLNRFDGYEFVSYKYDPYDSNSLSSNEISALEMEGDRYLWVGTRSGGLNRLELHTGIIQRFSNLTYDDLIRDIYYDYDGNLWAGTSEGLFLKEEINGQIVFRNLTPNAIYRRDTNEPFIPTRKNISVTAIYHHEPGFMLIGAEEGLFVYDLERNEFKSLSEQTIGFTVVTRFLRDSKGRLWATTYDGLLQINKRPTPSLYEVVVYDSNAPIERRLPVDWVEDIREDHRGNLWLATRGAGMVLISPQAKVERVFNYSVIESGTIPDNIINCLLIDRTGVLWIGTESRGLVFSDLYAKQFRSIVPGVSPNSGLSDHLVSAIVGEDNVLWVGTSSAGIDVFEINGGDISKRKNIPRVILSHGQWKSEILALAIDEQGALWIGSATNSLVRYTETKGFESYIVEGFVFALMEDNRGNIWFGTWGQGLGYINKSTREIIQFNEETGELLGLSSDKILSIYLDSNDFLWVGTKGGGVNVAHIDDVINQTADFTVYRHIPEIPGSLSYNDIYSVFEDEAGNIWLASGRGLNRLVVNEADDFRKTVLDGDAQFSVISERNGLPGGLVYTILEDGNNHLWLGTNNGLSRYSPFDQSIINYGENDGLPSVQFLQNSAFYDKRSGLMYFGGVGGITLFNPDSISINPFHAKVRITDFRLHNRSVKPKQRVGGRRILEKDIANTKQLRLAHSDNEISFEFSAMHFSSPEKIRYSYRLLGFNDEWQNVGSQNRRATYTNLSFGEYIFQVRATNNDGEWAPELTELHIVINPPLWLTKWAYIFYTALFLFLLYVFRKYSLIAVKKKNQLIIESLENKKETELAEAKMRFFTNVSHEIRTPLTLINAPLQEMIGNKSLPSDVSESLNMIYRNVKRLLNQVNQLLELRKMEKGQFKLRPSRFSLDVLIQEVLLDFESIIKQKEIKVYHDQGDEAFIHADKRLIGTVLYNLLSNSLKFTPQKGELRISISCSGNVGEEDLIEQHVILRVCDSGPGIPESELENVFNRFYQSKNQQFEYMGGSGIGLSIVKEFIDQHKGTVTASNLPEKGCCFEVVLPVSQNEATDSYKHSQLGNDFDQPGVESDVISNSLMIKDSGSDSVSDSKLPVLVVVEDDLDLSGYLKSFFSKKFVTHLFMNGKDAFDEIVNIMPDLVICDVMLPGMDGVQLTGKLKSREETSHIPVVMLTARSGEDNIVEGLSIGADSYITKPFSISVLEAQVNSLLSSQKAFKMRFSKKMVLEPTEESITPMDEKFLKKLIEVTEQNMADPMFDVTTLIDEMHMSHSIILKKVRALTGLSLVEFIRSMRIKRAAQIFRQDKLSVSEVSFMVGFSDPKYFSRCFSKEMGMKPTDFLKEIHG
ncbi:hybrid sensor histidine kinase/response regulator transcription factor [Alkalitalea saponilacus]|uniref:histidine kinase n=1 Tax=Alkalitalea saponilacus TaxID=889453 RepID=A0A1T5HSZ2_9BACT|nr:two-component regulator propeller domain-containing protein [Alkalitalea saponilacus]ASB47666.1 hybrid sensor histidine kinase/response regulator [Alkalitalea saponilacus]SKC23808.1 Signal transduction histidine kinase [Alkalitalea saponilacus]